MAGSKKKKSATLILLLIAMIVLIGACFWLIKYNDKKDAGNTEETETSTETIADIAEDSIQTIYFKNEKTEMTLVKDADGNWKNEKDESFPVNQTYAQNMSKAFTKLTSTRTLTEGVDDLSGFGLDNPGMSVTVTDKEGKETKVALGIEAPITGGYYAALNGDGKVYIIAASFYNNFNYDQIQMATVETLPAITAANITHLSVINKDLPGFEIQFNPEVTSDYAGISNWTMNQPYEIPLSADPDAVNTLLANYTALSFTSCVDYNAKDLSQYGLDSPATSVSLDYYEEFTKDSATADAANTTDSNTTDQQEEKTRIDYRLDLFIGSKDADGNYYVKTGDSSAVNTMSADMVDKIINIDAFSIVNHYVNLVNLDTINQVDITFEGKTYTLATEKGQATSDDGQSGDAKEEITTYYFNGTKVEEDPFKKLYQTIISPTTEHEIPAEYFARNKFETPYMTLTYHLIEGGTIEIAYKPYDDSYYVASTNGIAYFLTDLRKVKDIATALQTFTGK